MTYSSRELMGLGYSVQLNKYPASYNFKHKIIPRSPIVLDEITNTKIYLDLLYQFSSYVVDKTSTDIFYYMSESNATSDRCNVLGVDNCTTFPFNYNDNFYIDIEEFKIFLDPETVYKSNDIIYTKALIKVPKEDIKLMYSIFLDCSKKSLIYPLYLEWMYDAFSKVFTKTNVGTNIDVLKDSTKLLDASFRSLGIPLPQRQIPLYTIIPAVAENTKLGNNISYEEPSKYEMSDVRSACMIYLELVRILKENYTIDEFNHFKTIISKWSSEPTVFDTLYNFKTDTFKDSTLEDILKIDENERRYTELHLYINSWQGIGEFTLPFQLHIIFHLLIKYCEGKWTKEVFMYIYNYLKNENVDVDKIIRDCYAKDVLAYEDHDMVEDLFDTPCQKERIQPETIQNILKEENINYKYDIKEVSEMSDSVQRYEDTVNILKNVNNTLSKHLKEIKTYNTGGKNTGLSNGRLDVKNIHKYKTSSDIFYNNTYKIKESDLGIGIVLDMSGSMSGEKIKNGKAALILLHEVLLKLKINHSIIGHNSNKYQQCNIFKFYDFKEYRNKIRKAYNLVNAHVSSCNCDSGALYYMYRQLKRIQNKDKICIIFSDGEPTHCSQGDLLTQIKAMEMSGIKVIGIGINMPEISEYYTDNANATNLSDMFEIVSKILKEHILSKKD